MRFSLQIHRPPVPKARRFCVKLFLSLPDVTSRPDIEETLCLTCPRPRSLSETDVIYYEPQDLEIAVLEREIRDICDKAAHEEFAKELEDTNYETNSPKFVNLVRRLSGKREYFSQASLCGSMFTIQWREVSISSSWYSDVNLMNYNPA